MNYKEGDKLKCISTHNGRYSTYPVVGKEYKIVKIEARMDGLWFRDTHYIWYDFKDFTPLINSWKDRLNEV